MSKATITYTPDGGSAYVFTTAGATLYGAESVYESDTQDGIPRRRRTTYTLRQLFTEDTFADNEARYLTMRAALSASEGVLLITDENGSPVVPSVRVRVQSDVLPLDWRQYVSVPEVKMTGVENLVAATAWDATFTPEGGAAISLPAVKLFKGDMNAEFYGPMTNHRAEGMESTFIEGTYRADPALSPAARRAWLIAQKVALETAVQSAKEGLLTFGDYSKVVRVKQLTFPAGDLTSEMSWMISAERRWLPGDATTHAAFKLTTKDNADAAERVVTIAGTIKALTEAAATVKRTALRDAYLTAGRLIVDSAWEEDKVDGTDGAASLRVWSFAYSFRELLPGAVTRATLSIAESTDWETGIITSIYSGRVVAVSSAAALARARDWSAIYPWKISSSETVNSMSEGRPATTDIFSGVEFSYTYRRRGTEVRANVSDETQRQHFGNSARTVSGTAIASTEALALALARSFKPTGALMLTEVESVAKDYVTTGAVQQFKQINFSYTVHVLPLDYTIEYTKEAARDYSKGEVRTTYSGTAWAATEAECDRVIDALVATMSNILTDVRQYKGRAKGSAGGTATTYLESKGFNITNRADGAGSGGGGDSDTIKAEWTVASTYSHNHAVLTEIPFGVAHVQQNVGTTIGTKVASGSITTLDVAAGLTWARAKKPEGGYQRAGEQDQESTAIKQLPAPARTTVSFSYTRSYVNLTP